MEGTGDGNKGEYDHNALYMYEIMQMMCIYKEKE